MKGYPVFHGGKPTDLYVLEADLERGRAWVAALDRTSTCCPWALGWLMEVPGDGNVMSTTDEDGRAVFLPAALVASAGAGSTVAG